MVVPGRSTPAGWMRSLAEHYAATRRDHPHQDLCVVFDIDGTIVDLRHLVTHVLLSYDRERGTALFHGLVPQDVSVSENDVDRLLVDLNVPRQSREDVASFYRRHLWDASAVIAASVPYRGVLGVIRWFQIQPGTHVALNTGRPESMRRVTLDSLNAIAGSSRVRFEPELLFMRSETAGVADAKCAALHQIEASGSRLVAVIDNEPVNLEAMMASHGSSGALFLHADTIFDAQRADQPSVVSGTSYELAGLISEDRLRDHVELVWHGANDAENLRRFLASGIRWAEIDVRHDPVGRLVLRHDGFDERPWNASEQILTARGCVEALIAAGRSVKLDVKEGGRTLLAALDLLEELRLGDDRSWFNAEIQAVGPSGFAAIRERWPGAIVSCPVDFLMPLLAAAPDDADAVLRTLRSWGVTRLSVRWGRDMRRTLDALEERGWEANVYGLPDLQSFLEAAVLLPTSVTADFNFPEWRYHGRGSGQGGLILGEVGATPSSAR